MYLLRIAGRNLARNKSRTVIAIAAIATVVVIVIFSRGFMMGMTESMFGMYIDNTLGHVRVVDEEYNIRRALLPLDYTLGGAEEMGASGLVSSIEGLDSVQYVLPRVQFGAMASIDDELVRMVGIGTDMERERHHGVLKDDLAAGRFPESGNEILVGASLLRDMGKDVGDRVTLVFADAFQSLKGRTFEIVGVRDSGVGMLDSTFFYVPLETAQRMLELEDEATEVLVFGTSPRAAEQIQEEVRALVADASLPDILVQTWIEGEPAIQLYSDMNQLMNIAYLLFIIMGTVVIVSAMAMIVRERTSEIGMMGAMGLKANEIMRVFLYEGSFMGVLGSLVGVTVGGAITYYYSRAGLYVEEFATMITEVDMLIEPVFYIGFSAENLIVSFFMAAVIVVIACWLPARQAAAMDPVDALRLVEE